MSVRQYIGARYVPRFSDVNNGNWSSVYSYEPLTIVKNGNDYYTSKKSVPVGIQITNTEYWIKTGDYNGAISGLDTRVSLLEANSNYNGIETFGIVNDGTTDNTAAFKSIVDNVALKAGGYRISGSVTIDANVVFCGGAYLVLDEGAQVTFNNGILANPCQQIFEGNGDAIIRGEAYADWYGCKRNDDTFDNAALLKKAFDSCDHLILNGGVYYVTHTVEWVGSSKEVSGAGNGANWYSDADTTIVTKSTSLTPIVKIGDSGSESWHNRFSKFGVRRAEIGNNDTCIAVLITKTWSTFFEDVMARDWVCFKLADNTGLRFYKCSIYIRHSANLGYGWYIDNSSHPSVSTYIDACTAAGEANYTSFCVYFKGGADLFIRELEAGFCRGVTIDGNNDNANQDITILDSVFDNNKVVGIDIKNITNGSIIVSNCYCYGGSIGIRIEEVTNGNISLIGNEIQGSGSFNGLAIKNVSGIVCKGNIINKCTSYLDGQGNIKNCSFEDILNFVENVNTAAYLANAYNCYLRPILSGTNTVANMIYCGVFSKSELNATGIPSSKITGHLLHYGSTNVDAVGTTGSSIVSGTY